MRIKAFLYALLLTYTGLVPARAQKKNKEIARPKLIVGIVVDQMRYDYLYRYWSKYSNEGFKRLVQDGFSYENTHYNYVPTYTGPGHASVYTGTTPAIHGIIGNNWYDRATAKDMYCTEDKTVKGVGSSSVWGQMSPANLITTTITDQLRLATNMQSKVIGIALKDRGSILPAGHSANAAYWYDGTNGAWITSTYYLQQLPSWVQEFNNRKLPDQYLSQPWTTLLPLAQYTESTPDDNEFEKIFTGEQRPVFPHDLPKLKGKSWDIIRSSPFGNSLTKDFAIAAVKAEKLGKGTHTDFLALSFSSTDYVGHQFGPNAIETEDTYLRLDKDMAELLHFLDAFVGKKDYLVFLTADHGAAHAPAYANSVKLPANSLANKVIQDSLETFLHKQYGPGDWVTTYMNYQVYLNHALIKNKKVNMTEVQEKVADYLLRFEGILKTTTTADLNKMQPEAGLEGLMQRGYLRRRSGDVLVTFVPGWFEGYSGPETKGTTHGSAFAYDTHVPLLWYGWQVKKGVSSERVSITDIVPTLAQWLHIMEPNGNTGRPLHRLLNR